MADGLKYMKRALALAAQAEGFTTPNPMVGCVVVADGDVVGEGFHAGPGRPHAEVEALNAAGSQAKGATAYVTLEPCNHYGRTPPCTDALVNAGVAKVIYAVADPNRLAAGGAARLRAAGIEVESGLCASEAQAMNRFFFHSLQASRPYVVAKFAASLDGKIATRSGESQWITGPQARARAHDLRQGVDAILVGVKTIFADDPSLTARPEGRSPAPLRRIVADSHGRTPTTARIFKTAARNPITIATTRAAPAARLAALEQAGADIMLLPADERGRVTLPDLVAALPVRGVQSLMTEGGAEVLGGFFDAGLIDEVWAFLAPMILGGGGKSAIAGLGAETLVEALRLDDVEIETLNSDILLRGRVARRHPARRVTDDMEATCLQAS